MARSQEQVLHNGRQPINIWADLITGIEITREMKMLLGLESVLLGNVFDIPDNKINLI